MASLILHMLRRQSCPSMSSNLTQDSKSRNKLQKSPPVKGLYSCRDLPGAVQSQACLALFADDDAVTVVEDSKEAQPYVPKYQPQMKPNYSNDASSFYSQDEMKSSNIRRTRAKTPVFAIGQLERKKRAETHAWTDVARVLAEQYQAELPSRTSTPYSRVVEREGSPRSLRRIKCQGSLRDFASSRPETASSADSESTPSTPLKDQADGGNSSDSETLLGSESPLSPFSSALRNLLDSDFDSESDPFTTNRQATVLTKEIFRKPGTPQNDVGLKICMELLTDVLATALFRQHPAETGGKVSGLQILLMIEAYESVQQIVRRQMSDSHKSGCSNHHARAVEGILEHWLQALHSMHDLSLDHESSENPSRERLSQLLLSGEEKLRVPQSV